MQQRGRVNKFNGRREIMMGRAVVTAQLRRRDREQGPQPFAARTYQMLRKIGNHADRRMHPLNDERVNRVHIVFAERPEVLGGGKRAIALNLCRSGQCGVLCSGP